MGLKGRSCIQAPLKEEKSAEIYASEVGFRITAEGRSFHYVFHRRASAGAERHLARASSFEIGDSSICFGTFARAA